MRSPREPIVRALGLAFAGAYAGLIGWLITAQPRTLAEVAGGLTSSVGIYEIDSRQFAEGLRLFRRDQFAEARAAFARADPAHRDARTQFYIAYTFYRQGWGRLYHDDELYRQGLDAVERALTLAPGGLIVKDDPDLGAPSADELKVELQAGLKRDASDFNPLRVLSRRK